MTGKDPEMGGHGLFASVDASVSARGIFRTVVRVVRCRHLFGLCCGVQLPRAGMGVRRPGPNRSHALEARCEKLACRSRLSLTVRHTLLSTLLRPRRLLIAGGFKP